MMVAQVEKKKIPILMYHSISRYATPVFKPFTVSPELFAEHMKYLHEHEYTCITVTQFVNAQCQEGLSLPERPVLLTFDDGFADFFTEALPILERYNFVATLYIATAFIGSTSRWLQREGEAMRLMLTWEQVRQLSLLGIECGGHSHYHQELDILPQSIVRAEIVGCKRLLEDHLGQEVLSFAYPFGYYTTATQQLVREAGYTSACAVQYKMSSYVSDPFALRRLIVKADTNIDAFASLITGYGSSILTTWYVQARTPFWRLARRYSPLMAQRLQEGLSL